MDEIELLHREYGVGNLVMIDDSFIGSLKAGGERAVNIAEEIIRRGLKLHYLIMCKPEEVDRVIFSALKKSGLAAVSIGIESGTQSGLDRMNRNCTVGMCREALSILRELDLEVFIGLIPFDPDTTVEELEETIEFLYSLGELNVSLWRIAISDWTEEKYGEIRKQAREEVNEKSREILKGVIDSVMGGREESAILERAEREMENLYRKVSGLLQQIAY